MKQIIEDRKVDMGSVYFTDINDKKVYVSDYANKPVLIVGGAQKAAKESEKWGKALKSAFSDSVVLMNIAFVPKKPPASVMLSVKSQLKRGYGNVPFLISWGNTSDITTISDESLTHIFFVDRDGYLRIQYAENYSEACLAELIENVKRYI